MSYLFRPLGRDGTSQQNIDSTFFAASMIPRPYAHSTLGHYHTAHRCVLIAAQAANSRLWVIRNTGANIIVPLRLQLKWFQNAAHTAAIEDSLDLYKLTAFTVTDTTSTVTPAAVVQRVGGMAAAPGGVDIRGVTATGVAAGMTGATSTKSANSLASLPLWLTLAFADPSQRNTALLDALGSPIGQHPLILANNEGLLLENRVLLGAAAGSSLYIDFDYAELPALAAPLF